MTFDAWVFWAWPPEAELGSGEGIWTATTLPSQWDAVLLRTSFLGKAGDAKLSGDSSILADVLSCQARESFSAPPPPQCDHYHRRASREAWVAHEAECHSRRSCPRTLTREHEPKRSLLAIAVAGLNHLTPRSGSLPVIHYAIPLDYVNDISISVRPIWQTKVKERGIANPF